MIGVIDAARSRMSTEVIRRRLLARRSSLIARYRGGVERIDEELAEHQSEEAERAAEHWDATVISSLGNAEVSALGDVVAALVRLDAGSYGTCTICGEPIAERRLAVMPEATCCVSCAKFAHPTD